MRNITNDMAAADQMVHFVSVSARRFGMVASVMLISASTVALCGPASADTPVRVVSINLCTDQLALLLAKPGQLISVSKLAHDPASSAMVAAALPLPSNGSTAEDVYLLKPDLVLAGTFTSSATVSMLRDLGIRVEQFAPARSLDDVPKRVAQMGNALGRKSAAADLIAAFRDELAQIADSFGTHRPRAALTYVNNYSSGDKTLAGDILSVAGFDNVASEAGLSGSGTLSLEQLILLSPDVIIQGRNYPGTSRSEDNLAHPALAALKNTLLAGELTDRDWTCGTPHVLRAFRTMRDLRQQIAATR